MLRPPLIAALIVAFPAFALAQQPINLLPPPQAQEPTPPVSAADQPLLEESTPNFQPMRPVDPEPEGQASPAAPETSPPPAAADPKPEPLQPAPLQPAPAPPEAVVPAANPEPAILGPAMIVHAGGGLPSWAVAVLVLCGAFLAGLFGILTATLLRRGELRDRRRAVISILATELETRRLAFESLPLPPDAEAGVSFVSSVTSLAGIDSGFRSVQGNIHLLPDKLAAHVSVHYAAVQRVSDFVKGQSLAAAVRMLQANRLGGYPCPDAGTMRDAHVEMGAAFRGVEKLTASLRALR